MADTGFSRPSLADLIARIEADFNTRLKGADSRVRRSVLSVLARTVSAVSHSNYGYLDFIAKQLFADTAIEEYLLRLAAIYGLKLKDAKKATGQVTFTGVTGSSINIGKILQRGDGVEFVTTSAVTLSGGTGTASIEARETGEAGNTDNGTILAFTSPISGVNAQATSGQLSSGTNTEDPELLRARLLDKLRQPPHGGADFDYKAWALEVTGVTRAWVYPKEDGLGSVHIRFMMDDTYEDGIPEAADIAAVLAHIEELRPVTAEVLVTAPVAEALNLSIRLKNKNGETVDDPILQAAVSAELADLLQREAEPKADGTINTVPNGKILISHIRQAVSNAAGEYDHVITVPSVDLTPTSLGGIWKLGTITWLD